MKEQHSRYDQAKSEVRPDAERAWDKDSELRAEFNGDFDSYLAWATVEKLGYARIAGGGAVRD